MSIQKVVVGKRTRWKVRWLEAGRHRQVTFDLKGDAVNFEADQRRRLQMGAHAPAEPAKITLREWCLRWFEQGSLRWAASTRMHRGYILDKWIVPELGGVRLRDLGPARVRQWQAAIRKKGCSAHQANQALRILSAALGAAAKDGLLPSNPCVGVAKFRVNVKRPRALTPLEVEKIRAAMSTWRDVVLVSLMAYAGLRPEEALALRWGSVGNVLVIDEAWTHGELKGTKTHQRRTVEVVAPLAEDLEAARPRLGAPDHLVAPSETGRHLNLNNWRNRVWGPACEKAGVTATPYDLRHTYCSLLIHEGRSPLLVAATLGHASGEMVWRRYAHVFEEARLAPATAMVPAVEEARAKLARSGLRPRCAEASVTVLRAAPGRRIK